MTNFPIEFKYKGIRYIASIHRIASGPVQYHLHGLTPNIPLTSLIYHCNAKHDGLEYSLDPNFEGIEREIVVAISVACATHGIPLCAQ
jgi:hypothetical protein